MSDNSLRYTNLELAKYGGGIVTIYHVGNGPIVLYVHGWAHGSSRWKRFQEKTNTPFTHVAIDLPGLGKASKKEIGRPYVKKYAEFVRIVCERVCEHFQEPLEAIVAHSLGACSCAYALQQKSNVSISPKKLILLDAPLNGNLILKFLVLLYPIVLLFFSLRSIMPRWMGRVNIRIVGLLTTYKWSAMDGDFVDDAMAPRAKVLTDSLFSAGFCRIPWNVVPNSQDSIVLARGKWDWVMTPWVLRRYAKAWKANTHTFPGATHTPFMETPAKFDEWLESELMTVAKMRGKNDAGY